jgi:1-hydroxycarotenoid 3,4-desaturase
MLVAHVEQVGVWQIEGGMRALAEAMLALVRSRGVAVRTDSHVSRIRLRQGRVALLELADGEELPVDAAVLTSDATALGQGLYGPEVAPAASALEPRRRSLSALTWNVYAPTGGFELSRHNVFFSNDYAGEFADLGERQRLPVTPTVYICAQDRDGSAPPAPGAAERLLCLVNAPATGDSHRFDAEEIDLCLTRTLATLQHCGLLVQLDRALAVATTPTDFNRLFPGSGGALYGQATHGWQASFNRPGARSSIPGLYLAGGSTHPGPGLPMAALSARHAASCLRQDLASSGRFPRVAMSGGTSTL